MKRCPMCGNQTFHANAHVVQGWLVDSDGACVAVSEECVEVAHSPEDDDLWTCAKCRYDDLGAAFEVKTISPEDELAALKREQLCYISNSGGVLEVREADDAYNDYNRKMIQKFKETYGSAYIGRINYYGPDRRAVSEGKMSVFEEYIGQMIYNFACDFIVATQDPILEKLISHWNSNKPRHECSDMNKIFARIEEIGGISFIWY